uniref:Uncharacterized protein n=1 Tax=Anopheles dirus TaxID=7168 RepID=A0A182NVD5_9DIPT
MSKLPFQFVINPIGSCRLCVDPDEADSRMIGCNGSNALMENIIKGQNEQAKELSRLVSNLSDMKTGTSIESSPIPGPSKQDDATSQNSSIITLLKRQALMQLPRFDGNSRDWPNFKKTFDDTTREGAFSNLENLNRLKQVLHGPAYKCVQQLMMESENIPEIIERLNETFGRADLVYLELLKDLQRLRKDSKGIVAETSSALENLISNVKLMDKPAYLNDHRLVMEIISKLPYNIQVERAKYMAQAKDSQALMQLPRFDGNSRDWPNFKKTFDDTTREGAFSNLENLNRLKQVLHGPAYKCVQQLMMESENIPEIIERLNETFGRADLVYLELLKDLQRLRKDSKGIVAETSSALENLISNVKLMDKPAYLNDHRLVMEIISKLPYNIQVERAKYMAQAKD